MDKGDQKAPFSIATSLLHLYLDCSTLPFIYTLYCWVLSKEVSSTISKVFGTTRPGIEPRSPRPLANTIYIYIYIYECVCVCVCVWERERESFWIRLSIQSVSYPLLVLRLFYALISMILFLLSDDQISFKCQFFFLQNYYCIIFLSTSYWFVLTFDSMLVGDFKTGYCTCVFWVNKGQQKWIPWIEREEKCVGVQKINKYFEP